MKKSHIATIITFLLVIFMIIYMGFFQKISFEEKKTGPFLLVYEEYTGDYKNINTIQDKIKNKLNKQGITDTETFAIFYSDTESLPKEEWKSIGGVIINEKDYNRLDKEKFNIINMNKQKRIYTEFPYRNRLSTTIAITKVYPRLAEYVKEKNYEYGPVMELYKKDSLVFLMGIEHREVQYADFES